MRLRGSCAGRVAVGVVVVGAVLLAGCSSSGSKPTSSGSTGTPTPGGSSSRNVSFIVDGTTTYGTLEVPARRGGERLAAALLIPGSGPTDRNGNQPPQDMPDTLELLANALARQGIITLRFDKYFTGQTGAGRYTGDPASATVQGDLRQADAAYAFLSRQPQVDPGGLLVVGHSEGGMFALQIASSAATKPAGLALLEPQDLRILDLIRIQADEAIKNWVTQGTLSTDQGQANVTAVAQAISQFRAGDPVDTTGMAPQTVQFLAPLILTPSGVRYVHSWDLIEPATLAATVKSGTRVLVTDGTRDTNVPPSTINPLMRALTSADITGPGLTLLPGTDHDMHLANQPDTDAVLAPAVTAAIERWARPFATTR